MDLIRATNGLPQVYQNTSALSVAPRASGCTQAWPVVWRLPFGYHNGLCDANRCRGFHVRLEGSGATCQSRACLTLVLGVALSSATAATFRNGEPGSGERLRLHYVSLYRSAPRSVHCSYWNQARACVLFSLLLRPGRRRLLLPLPSSSSRYIRVYAERARYAHRPSNRGTTRVKTIPSRRAGKVRERERAPVSRLYRRAIKLATSARVLG